MNFEVAKFQLDLTKTKLKGSSLFLHQALKALLKQHESKIKIEKNEGKEESMRKIIAAVRQNEDAFITWNIATKQKYPYLEELCNSACLLNYRIMTSDYALRSSKPTTQEIQNFWRSLFEHFLKLSFIHPQFFINDSYTLGRSVDIIKDSWEDFIAMHVILDFETPSLTSTDLERLGEMPPGPTGPPADSGTEQQETVSPKEATRTLAVKLS